MPLTPYTSPVSYLTAGDAIKLGDWRVFADLCSDTGIRIASAGALASDGVFQELLAGASGEVEAACLVGGKVTPDDLAELISPTPPLVAGVGAARLRRLVYRIAVVFAFERRPQMEMKQPWIYEQVMVDLTALRRGEQIFSFTESMEAGVLDHQTDTAAYVNDRNGVVVQASRFFGTRANQMNG